MEKTDFTIALSAQDIELKRLLSEFLLGDDQWWLMFKCSFCRMNMKKMQEAFGNIRIAQIEHLCTTRYELVLSCEESWFNSGVGIKGTGLEDASQRYHTTDQERVNSNRESDIPNYWCNTRRTLEFQNRVGGKRSGFLPTFVFRLLTPSYVRLRIREFLISRAIDIVVHQTRIAGDTEFIIGRWHRRFLTGQE